MKDSPLYEEIIEEARIEEGRKFVQAALAVRFGDTDSAEFAIALWAINDAATLHRLHRLAMQCSRVTEFRKGLSAELAAR